jgi:hypothetical protein
MQSVHHPQRRGVDAKVLERPAEVWLVSPYHPPAPDPPSHGGEREQEQLRGREDTGRERHDVRLDLVTGDGNEASFDLAPRFPLSSSSWNTLRYALS